MRIGIDCDGVLRDLIPCITDSIKETHPEHADKILAVETWDWVDWLPFWTNEEAEKYIFEDNYIDFFGVDCPPIKEAVEDWNKLREWADKHGHKLVLVMMGSLGFSIVGLCYTWIKIKMIEIQERLQ